MVWFDSPFGGGIRGRIIPINKLRNLELYVLKNGILFYELVWFDSPFGGGIRGRIIPMNK